METLLVDRKNRAVPDELDFRPLFTDGVRTAENPLYLVQSTTRLNFPALAVFLRLGFYIGDDTAFKGIRQMLPSAAPRSKPISIGRDHAIRTYAQLFECAIASTLPLPPNTYVPLSGGRDSRHIALALDKLDAKPAGFITHCHLPPRSNDDVEVARVLAKELGVPWRLIQQPKFFVGNILRAFKETGFLCDEGAQMVAPADWLRANASCIYDGIGGDIMSAGLFQDRELHALYSDGQLDEAADWLFRTWGKNLSGWEDLVDKDIAPLLSENVARERLKQELEKHVAHHNPTRSFFFWNRTRREIALCPFLIYKGIKIHAPYLDRELWEFLDGLPYEIVADRSFHTDTIRCAYPRFAEVRFENSGARAFTRLEATAFTLDFLMAAGKNRLLLKRSLRLFRNGESWWNPVIVLYLVKLLGYISNPSEISTPNTLESHP